MNVLETLLSARSILWLLVGLSCAHIAYYYPQLPERVASHFGPSGVADGYMHKSEFATFYVALVIIVAAILSGIGELVRHTPDDLINLPNKDYWLAPERHDATIAKINAQMASFGVATMALLLVIMHLAIVANLGETRPPQLSLLFFPAFLAYIGYVIFWTVGLLRRFNKVPEK
jgi:uncharacterized membrane protein